MLEWFTIYEEASRSTEEFKKTDVKKVKFSKNLCAIAMSFGPNRVKLEKIGNT